MPTRALLDPARRSEIARIAEQLEALAAAYQRSAHQRRCLRVYNASVVGAQAVRELLALVDAAESVEGLDRDLLLKTVRDLTAIDACAPKLPSGTASHPLPEDP